MHEWVDTRFLYASLDRTCKSQFHHVLFLSRTGQEEGPSGVVEDYGVSYLTVSGCQFEREVAIWIAIRITQGYHVGVDVVPQFAEFCSGVGALQKTRALPFTKAASAPGLTIHHNPGAWTRGAELCQRAVVGAGGREFEGSDEVEVELPMTEPGAA